MKKDIVYILTFCIIASIIIGAIVVVKTFYPLRYTDQVVGYAKKHHIDPYLALAVINTESRFNKNATSSQEAKGLMQITDATAKEVNDNTNSAEEINDDTLYDVDVNVELGCNYLQSLILKYNGNYYLAVIAYNAGMGNVDKWMEQGIVDDNLNSTDIDLPFSETEKYLKKVIHNYKAYKLIYPSLK